MCGQGRAVGHGFEFAAGVGRKEGQDHGLEVGHLRLGEERPDQVKDGLQQLGAIVDNHLRPRCRVVFS